MFQGPFSDDPLSQVLPHVGMPGSHVLQDSQVSLEGVVPVVGLVIYHVPEKSVYLFQVLLFVQGVGGPSSGGGSPVWIRGGSSRLGDVIREHRS